MAMPMESPRWRRRGLSIVAVTALLLTGFVSSSEAAPSPAAVRAVASAAPADPGEGWELVSSSPAEVAVAPAYLGNGYVGTRIPADGAGFVAEPVATQTHIAGVYADVPDLEHGGTQQQGATDLPGWTQLDVVVAGRCYAAADAQDYRQVLDLRRGVVTTTATWAVGDRVTDLAYEVTLDRTRQRVGLVRLQLTPRWSGTLEVRDVLGGGSDATPQVLEPVAATADPATALLAVRTAGTNTMVAEVTRLQVPEGSAVTAQADLAAMIASRTVDLPVQAGQTYEVTKVVGFATSSDAADPIAAARDAAGSAPNPATVLSDSAAAWAALWDGDIVLPGQPELQRRVRAAMFYLLASLRPDVDWSTSPVGLSGSGYNSHVFWDAETWMYPALLAQHPAEAGSVVDYRYLTRGGAERNAKASDHAGLRYAWESALTGDEVTPTWAETGRLEQHVTSDVALAQWQYYLATGDRDLLRDRGWPVIQGAAEFWASRAEPGTDGRFHITVVEGPDEQNWPVNDSTYTNAAAATTLRIAMRVGALLGQPTPPLWAQVADGLAVQGPQPLGGQPAVRPEFRGYAGQEVKQADTVLLTYPWEYPQPAEVDRSDLEYYTPRYDPDGPAMTDSASSIIAAQLGGDCSAWTYTRRSVDPFVVAPYEQFTEARSGQGVFTFLTGEGGFLQEFLYGYPGLRWREDAVRLDPMLLPQLSDGLRLTGLQWQGREFDISLEQEQTTLTLRSGPAMTVEVPDGRRSVSTSAPLVLPTRTIAPAPENLALCRPVTASVADPSGPAAAAVDGSAATAWFTGTDPAIDSSLTVSLDGTKTLTGVTATWQEARPLTAYEVQVGTGDTWRTVATVSSATGDIDTISFLPVEADAVRLHLPATRYGGQEPRLAELAVQP